MRIFLSYAREDEQSVVQIYDYLVSLGHQPWMDQKNLIGGIAWKEEIELEIRRCDMFLMFLSRHSAQKRGIIQREIKAALDKAREFLPSDIFIVPILIEKCETPDDLVKYHWIDLRDKEWKTKIAQTLEMAERQRAGALVRNAGALKAGVVKSEENIDSRMYARLALGGVVLLLAALNAFATAISALLGLLLVIFVFMVLGGLLLLPRVRRDQLLFGGTVIVAVGAAATTIHFAMTYRVDSHIRLPVDATQHDLVESAAAMESCNANLTLECMVAGGVRAEAAAGRHLMACTTATILQSDDPSLAWKDVWTTSVYSYAPGGGGPGGGRDDDELKVGGWGDDYYTLISFALPTLAFQPKFAAIVLYSKEADVASTGLAVDRIAQAWDFPKGDRLWWKDRPRTLPTDMQVLLAPGRKQWYMIELTSLVGGWRSNTFANHGIEIRPLETNNNYVLFVSSDASDKSKTPRLLFCP
jgi:TIR domain